MTSPCERLLQLVAARQPDAAVDVRTFPSGSFLIDVRLGAEVLVVEHRPGDGYGMSILSSEEGDGFTGHHHVFRSEEDLLRHLDLTLRGRACAPRV